MSNSDINILIVDDSKTDITIISNILNDYSLLVALDGFEAMRLIQNNPDISIVLLDLSMPGMDGFEVLQALKDNQELNDLDVIILTNYDEVENEIKGLELGAVDYIRKPVNIQSIRKRIEIHTNLQNARKKLEMYNADLERDVALRTSELVMTRDMTINALISLLELRDIESSNHTKRTRMMMKALCEQIRTSEKYKDIMTDDYIALLCSTAPLHDIGKIGIPDCILSKPGKLTSEEFEIMKKHVDYGMASIRLPEYKSLSANFNEVATEIISTHHEKYDGTGYPNGLKGEEIPLSGRLMAIIDVFDALVNKRVYKPAFSYEDSLKIISEGRNSHFDPDITDAFFSAEDKFLEIIEKYVPIDSTKEPPL